MKSQMVAHSQEVKFVEWDNPQAYVEHKINGSVFRNYICSWRVELFVSVLRGQKMLFSGSPKSCIDQ